MADRKISRFNADTSDSVTMFNIIFADRETADTAYRFS